MDIKSVLVLVMTLLSFPNSEMFILLKSDPRAMVYAVENIVTRFYCQVTPKVYIMEQSTLMERKGMTPIEIAGEMIQIESKMLSITYVMENSITLHRKKIPRFYNIFIVDSYESFRNIFIEMNVDTYYFNGFYTIVLTEHFDDNGATIQRILDDCWSLYITNVIILAPSDDYTTIHLYTYFPYSPDYCEKVVPVIHDYFENYEFARNAPLFPEKLRNLHKCPLKVATYDFVPFVKLTPTPDGYFIDGVEGTLVRVLGQRLNFTPIAVLSTTNLLKKITDEDSGAIKPTIPRSLDLVENGTANFTMGVIVIAENRATQYSMAFAHYYGSLVYAIPPARQYTSFEKLFFPFGIKTWSLISGMFFSAAVMIVVLKLSSKEKRNFILGKSNTMPFFNMISVCLGTTIPFKHVPLRNFARTLLLIWLLSTLVLRNAYQGQLYDNLRSRLRKPPFYTLKELFESDLRLFIYASFYQDFVDNNPEYKSRSFVYNGSNLDLLWNLNDDKFNGAYMMISEVIDYFNILHFPEVNIHKTKEIIQQMPFCIYARKHSCLTKPFNSQIDLFRSSGLVKAWDTRNQKLYDMKKTKSQPVPIPIYQIFGAIAICLMLQLICVVIFILELMSTRYENIKLVLDFLVLRTTTRNVQSCKVHALKRKKPSNLIEFTQ